MNIMNQVTLKGLKKNTTRTIVTIIGVILSAAMITAVTTFVSSIQNYILDYSIALTGDWHGMVEVRNLDDYQEIKSDDRVENIGVSKSGGFALLEGGMNEYKPYLHIMELDQNAFNVFPIHLSQGRLPSNENEVIIASHILDNGGVNFKVGDEIELEVGERYQEDGRKLDQKDAYQHERDGVAEAFKVTGERTFLVVGIYDRFSFDIEGYSAPGYSIITTQNTGRLKDGDLLQVYFNAKKPTDIYDIVAGYFETLDIDYNQYNSDVLRYQGISDVDGFSGVLYGLTTIVVLLIMVGSISLIYNSFSISVSERKKQFGLLSSVGATTKQLMNSVFFEALFIAMIGIPIGIGSGILGIGVTLYYLRDNFVRMFGERVPVELRLSVSLLSIIAAVILSLITILISAYIPARRTKKMSAMDAVRQTTDIKLSAKKVKTSPLTRKVFGIEGDLALKNLKRNRKRYRSTVFSLLISVVLFISTSSFSMYLTDSAENVYEDYEFDLAYNTGDLDVLSENNSEIYKDILSLESVQKGSISRIFNGDIIVPKDLIEKSYYDKVVKQEWIADGEDLSVAVNIYSVDHETFLNYVDELGLDKKVFENSEKVSSIAIDKQHYFDYDTERYVNSHIFAEEKKAELTVQGWIFREDGEVDTETASIKIESYAETTPLGIPKFVNGNNGILLIIDDSILMSSDSDLESLDWGNYTMYFESKDPNQAEEDMEKLFTDVGLGTDRIFNAAERVEDNRNMVTILNVFAYGFIILMSLVTIANVFNTITTNLNLRRREFAMLKSVGMTNYSFHKMLNYECIFYGLKALLYGLPCSVLITYFIYLSIIQGVDTSFSLPIYSILISIFSVFLVVFISMLYSMRKIKKENILEGLKNENL